MEKYKVLATSWHPSSTNSIISVIKKLRKQDREVVVLGTKYSSPIFDQENISYTSTESYGIQDFSEGEMERILIQESPNIVLAGTSFQEPIKGDFYVPDQTILNAARRQGIPSLRVQDWWSPATKHDDVVKGILNAFLPDKIALMDEYVKLKMLKKGIPEEILEITGYPELDTLQEKKRNFTSKKKNHVLETLRIQNTEKVFFYAGGIDWPKNLEKLGYWNLDVIETIINALKNSPNENVSFIMGIHPRIPDENKITIDKYIKEANDPRVILRYGLGSLGLNSEEVSLATDATFVSFSSVGMKSAYLGKPSFSLQPNLILPSSFEDGDLDFFLKNKDSVPLGLTPLACKYLLEKAMKDETLLKNLEQRLATPKFNVVEGEATKNVINLMDKLVENN